MNGRKIKSYILSVFKFLYINIIKHIFFLFDAETVHNSLTSFGQILGEIKPLVWLVKKFTNVEDPALIQTLNGIHFSNPLGLSAGFDYEAKLTKVLPMIGFGFGTIGTITNKPYEGNPLPRLGRLVRSRSLLVNKGFKNLGIDETLKKLWGENFDIPIGLSIGVTNSKTITDQDVAVQDIVKAFKAAEKSSVPFSYYEMNISCPNLSTKVEFYSPDHLDKLLSAITKTSPSKPIFMKMPIDKTDTEILEMLKVIDKYPIKGVIFGNLQKNRQDPSLDHMEIKDCPKGNFSGKPTEKRSNELIKLTYKTYKDKFTIVGCGGIFSAEDAYKKIKLGASLVEMITGMIYMGPQIITEINLGLLELLKRDGFRHISEAVGMEANRL